MNVDDHTLPEAHRRELVKASFRNDESAHRLVMRALGEHDPRDRVLALRAASRHHWLENARWVHALSDPAPQVRQEAATLIARMKLIDDAVTNALVTCLRDSDALVVDAAAFALGELEDAAAVPALIELARTHDDARCRESAVAALGAIGDPRAVDTVIDALEDKPAIRRRAVVALVNFDDPRVDEALERARDDRDWQVRAAVDQLGIAEARDV
jgi:HEAT repeat protein